MAIALTKQKGNLCLASQFVLFDLKEQNGKTGKTRIVSAIQLTKLQSLSHRFIGILGGTQSKAGWESMFAMPIQLLLSLTFVGS